MEVEVEKIPEVRYIVVPTDAGDAAEQAIIQSLDDGNVDALSTH